MPPGRLNGGAIKGSLPTARNDMLWGLSTHCASPSGGSSLQCVHWRVMRENVCHAPFLPTLPLLRPSPSPVSFADILPRWGRNKLSTKCRQLESKTGNFRKKFPVLRRLNVKGGIPPNYAAWAKGCLQSDPPPLGEDHFLPLHAQKSRGLDASRSGGSKPLLFSGLRFNRGSPRRPSCPSSGRRPA